MSGQKETQDAGQIPLGLIRCGYAYLVSIFLFNNNMEYIGVSNIRFKRQNENENK